MNINYNDFENESEIILKSKKISSIRDLEVVVYHMIKNNFNIDEIKKQIKDFEINFNIKDMSIDTVIDIITKKGIPENMLKSDTEFVILYKPEIEYLKMVKDEIIRKILYLFLIISKWSNHPSGWIRYDKKYMFNFWNIKCKESIKTNIINECCKNGIELRVIGSKNPITCFKVNFRYIDSEQVKILKDNSDIKKIYEELFEVT